MTTAAPAVASDFRGFFSLFIAGPLLIWIALVIGAVLMRRHTSSRTDRVRHLPALMLLSALPPFGFLGLLVLTVPLSYGVVYAVITGAALIALGLWAGWQFWKHPYGRTATYSARVLGVMVVATVGVMVLDVYNVLSGRDYLRDWLGPLMCLAGLVALTLYLCIKVGLTRAVGMGAGSVARQSTADNGASSGGA
ncbi:hypothetical protein [Stenotrophomonas sp. PS02289]|uniref:hypothetical protein n=1 Tax=Stenotrophomonas sp. PS02289 TaxID=2991422 RepID=UPI00249AEEF2|nr:hypothetical protein [Stenotrophomonas sp. PS02289]